MNKYEFTLIFRLPNESDEPDAFIEDLGEAGCTDALVGVGTAGSIALDFCRKAASAQAAVASATGDVQRAIPGASLIDATDAVPMAGVKLNQVDFPEREKGNNHKQGVDRHRSICNHGDMRLEPDPFGGRR